MKKVLTTLLCVMSFICVKAQTLETADKSYGEGYAITVILPTVENFITLASLSESEFEEVMKKYKYFEEDSEGRYRSFWNGTLDNFAYAQCVNTFLYDIISERIRFMMEIDMAYPSSCITDLYRKLKPYYKQSKMTPDGFNVELFGFKINSWAYYITIYNNGERYDISAWREKIKNK